MQRSRGHRFQSLLLLLALVGAGFGLPLFDAVVFHGRPLAAAENAVAPEGAPAQHTQLCILDHTGLLEGGILSAGHETLAVLPVVAQPATAPDSADLPLDASLLPPSRAPPAV
jgi:hypothetical protein